MDVLKSLALAMVLTVGACTAPPYDMSDANKAGISAATTYVIATADDPSEMRQRIMDLTAEDLWEPMPPSEFNLRFKAALQYDNAGPLQKMAFAVFLSTMYGYLVTEDPEQFNAAILEINNAASTYWLTEG